MTAYRRVTPRRIYEKAKQYTLSGTARLAPALFGQPYYTCPLCGFHGPFVRFRTRANALSPKCGSLERHRLQKLVLDYLIAKQLFVFAGARCLQIAPDAITPILRRLCSEVVAADVNPKPGSIRLDMCAMDFEDASFDVIYASHVLEHIPNDFDALKETKRVLRSGGIAILPVPASVDKTIEYDAAKPEEDYHWRLVGYDYFGRYEKFFKTVTLYKSRDFPNEYQTYSNDTVRKTLLEDVVPVCVAG